MYSCCWWCDGYQSIFAGHAWLHFSRIVHHAHQHDFIMSLLYSNALHSHMISIPWNTFAMWWNRKSRTCSYWMMLACKSLRNVSSTFCGTNNYSTRLGGSREKCVCCSFWTICWINESNFSFYLTTCFSCHPNMVIENIVTLVTSRTGQLAFSC